jgi:hypothetical protein
MYYTHRYTATRTNMRRAILYIFLLFSVLGARPVTCEDLSVRNTAVVFNECTSDTDCVRMNGKCFDSRGNDAGRHCSCAQGFTFDAPNAVCTWLPSFAQTVDVIRPNRPIYYAEQSGISLLESRARFPSNWTCDTENRFCWATTSTVYFTSFDIDAITDATSSHNSIRFADVIWHCRANTVFYRRSDRMSSDPDDFAGMRSAHEHCLTRDILCNGNGGTGVPGNTTGTCACNAGWTGPTCSSKIDIDIARPVVPARRCAFPLNSTCRANELCYKWEGAGSEALEGGWCWCGPGYVPAAALPQKAQPDACVAVATTTAHGIPAYPYAPHAAVYRLTLDASRQYMHYYGQGYSYASISPYAISTARLDILRINDTMADIVGSYLWRCEGNGISAWNETVADCIYTPSYTQAVETRMAGLASAANTLQMAATWDDSCVSSLFGPGCTETRDACSTFRCTGHGSCTGAYQGCDCERGWGLYNCSVRTCGPNEYDTTKPHVYSATLEKCNCSAAYTGTFCESYTCGNVFATYDFISKTCTCAGKWEALTEGGPCTINTCGAGLQPSDIDPSFCVITPPSAPDNTTRSYGRIEALPDVKPTMWDASSAASVFVNTVMFAMSIVTAIVL